MPQERGEPFGRGLAPWPVALIGESSPFGAERLRNASRAAGRGSRLFHPSKSRVGHGRPATPKRPGSAEAPLLSSSPAQNAATPPPPHATYSLLSRFRKGRPSSRPGR